MIRLTFLRCILTLVFGSLLIRILTTSIPSFVGREENRNSPLLFTQTNIYAKIENNGLHNDDIMPKDWRQWLDFHSHGSDDTVITIDKVEPTSVHADWGCGISIRVHFEPNTETTTTATTATTSTKAFFKASYADMSHYDAESHLREIKAFYLDRILRTNVVLPCVGYHFHRPQHHHQQQDNNNWAIIHNNLKCISNDSNQYNTSDDNVTTVEGSMMLWLNGLREVDKEKIVKIARPFDINNYSVGGLKERRERQQSAMNYAIFHYLGACMKSEHNHFLYSYHKNKNHSSVDGDDDDDVLIRRNIAIDNDRCMTPKSIHSNRDIVPELHFNRIKLWEKLVFERVCEMSNNYRLPVLQVVQQAAAQKGSTINKSSLISSRLIEALKEDVLSHELAMSQPETFYEIDERINKLGEYMRKNCPQEAT